MARTPWPGFIRWDASARSTRPATPFSTSPARPSSRGACSTWMEGTPMAADRTRHVRLFGLDVKDEFGYRRYREGMTPILKSYGGSFGYDFVVSQVLKSETAAPINRVFTVVFSDAGAAD